MKQKVLFVMESLGIGGAEKSLVTILSMLDREKYDLYLYLFHQSGPFLEQIPEDVTLIPVAEIDAMQKNFKTDWLIYLLHLELKRSYYSLKWLFTSGKVTGKADGTLKVAAVIKTGTKTTKVYKEITVYAPLDIADVVPSADASVLSVLFTTPVKAVEARNFYFVGGEISVANAKLSEDGKSATLTLDKSLTSTVKITNAKGGTP